MALALLTDLKVVIFGVTWLVYTRHWELLSSNSCPCSSVHARMPPQFIGDNYYCESGNPTNSFDANHCIYSNNKLWDGQQCEGSCCNGTGSSPPWFGVQLPAPTTDMIEVRMCLDQGTNNEDTAIELIEIYVQ